jgi:hypothetical protein
MLEVLELFNTSPACTACAHAVIAHNSLDAVRVTTR